MTKILFILFLLVPAIAHAGPIIDGKEWRQITETTNFTWNQFASVCNPATGLCSGSLSSVNFDGWTWASVDEVNALFNTFIPGTIDDLGPGPDILEETASTWIPTFMNTFTPTVIAGNGRLLGGRTRSTRSTTAGSDIYVGSVLELFPNPENSIRMRTDILISPDSASESTGGWFFRTPSSVPEPSMLALLTFGLLGLSFKWHRRPVSQGAP